jgi:hypothetical protein
MRVIEAARAGRYMHGNGAMWYLVDEQGRQVLIDTVNGTITPCPEYNASEPHVNNVVANELENWLMIVPAEQGYASQMPRWSAMEAVRSATASGRLLFTNGGQWFVEEGGTVVSYELGVNAPDSARYAYSIHGAWKYRRCTTTRVIVTDDIRKFLDIA